MSDKTETARHVSGIRALLFFVTGLATLCYLGWRTFYTLPLGYGVVPMVAGLLLLLSECLAGFEAMEQYLNMVNFAEPELPVLPESMYPDVDVFIMTHNEDVEILYKTVNGCIHMDYPDLEKVHIYICDDNNRPEMRELAERFGVGYFGLSGNKHAKAGNMNHALSKTTSPYIATFDADMIPRHMFLMQTIPYFFLPRMTKRKDGSWVELEPAEAEKNRKIGFVQMPQSFYNADLFQYNLYAEQRIPNEQDYFFRDINVGRNRNNASIFAGSNAVLSREALNEVGGIAINTITEDFETGLRIQNAGYRTYALSRRLANGLAPHSIAGLVAQRERWARGCVQSLRNVGLFSLKELSWNGKISYTFCLVYWWTSLRRFIYISMPILSALFHVTVLDVKSLWVLLLFWLPYYLLNNRSLDFLSGSTRTQHWSNLIETILFPYLIIPVLLETLGIKKKKFVVTEKKKDAKPVNTLMLALPHILLLILSAAALVMCVMECVANKTLYNFIIIFWLVVNSKNLILSIFFMMGRENFRKTERYYVSLPVRIQVGAGNHEGVTADVSEAGMSVLLPYPYFLPDDEEFQVEIASDRYRAEVKCAMVSVDYNKASNKWKYSMRLTEADEKNRREYFQIVFDQNPTLPEKIDEMLTIYDDFALNIGERLFEEYTQTIRRLPRIALNVSGKTDKGDKVTVVDYNYKFTWVEGMDPLGEGMTKVHVAPDICFELQTVEKARSAGDGRLYKIINWQSLYKNASLKSLLDKNLSGASA